MFSGSESDIVLRMPKVQMEALIPNIGCLSSGNLVDPNRTLKPVSFLSSALVHPLTKSPLVALVKFNVKKMDVQGLGKPVVHLGNGSFGLWLKAQLTG